MAEESQFTITLTTAQIEEAVAEYLSRQFGRRIAVVQSDVNETEFEIKLPEFNPPANEEPTVPPNDGTYTGPGIILNPPATPKPPSSHIRIPDGAKDFSTIYPEEK